MDSHKELAKMNKALGNERRLHILRYLRNQGAKSVGEIAKEVRIGIRPTSKHLQLLESVGFLEQRRKWMFVHYDLVQQKNALLKMILSIL